MKRLFGVVFLGVILLSLVIPGLFVLAQERKPVIAQPEQDANVRGVVQIVGSATHPQFQRYELYYAPWPVPSDQAWIFIGEAHFQQQPLGLLGTWPTTALPDGVYALRVRVVKVDGNYIDSDPRRVVVANRRAPDTPTPAVTNTPAAPAVSPTPTPTVPIIVPTVEVPRPSPTPAVQPSPTPLLSASRTGSAGSSTGGQLVNLDRLQEVAFLAAMYTLAAFLAVGVFFAVKWMLVWLWHKIRP